MNAPDARFEAEPSVANHFAWIRTRFALERTLLAWERTAIALIGFGFTIVQFFQRLQDMPTIAGRQMRPQDPRDLGLALIATGIIALAISVYQYWRIARYLFRPPFDGIAGFDRRAYVVPSYIVAAILMIIGVAAFVSVFFHFL